MPHCNLTPSATSIRPSSFLFILKVILSQCVAVVESYTTMWVNCWIDVMKQVPVGVEEGNMRRSGRLKLQHNLLLNWQRACSCKMLIRWPAQQRVAAEYIATMLHKCYWAALEMQPYSICSFHQVNFLFVLKAILSQCVCDEDSARTTTSRWIATDVSWSL